MAKRFVAHDPTVTLPAGAAGPALVSCTRCGKQASRVQGSPTPLYGALVDLDEHPCALVALDDSGWPRAG
jgi:hypothetical protein